MIRAVVFDAYGTLFDTGTSSVTAAGEILRRAGREEIDPAAFYSRWKKIHRQHLACPDGFVPEAEIYARDLAQLYREYGIRGDAARDVAPMLAIQGRRVPYPEVKSVLQALRGRCRICIGSTTDTAPLLLDMQNGGIEVDGVFTSESLGVYKPYPAFYQKILQAIGLPAQEVLFVGDKLSDDVQGPQSAGMHGCWVNRKGEDPGDIRPEYTVRDLRAVTDIVRNSQ